MALVEPRPRASDTIMNYSSEFITEEAVSWLQSHGMRLKKGKVSKRNFLTTHFTATLHTQTWPLHWSLFVSYLAEKDGCDGQDLLAIAQDADIPRHYILIIKERLKFKKLIAMNAAKTAPKISALSQMTPLKIVNSAPMWGHFRSRGLLPFHADFTPYSQIMKIHHIL